MRCYKAQPQFHDVKPPMHVVSQNEVESCKKWRFANIRLWLAKMSTHTSSFCLIFFVCVCQTMRCIVYFLSTKGTQRHKEELRPRQASKGNSSSKYYKRTNHPFIVLLEAGSFFFRAVFLTGNYDCLVINSS